MQKKLVYIGLPVILVVAFLAWLFIESSKPLPGTKIADLGREHIELGKEVQYNSNPPTSGPHYADWVRSGVYTDPKDDRNLVHSLEHGYIIMSYKCNLEGNKEATKSAEATDSSTVKRPEACEKRSKELEEIYNKKGKRKLIVVSRQNLETNFALTAWTYLDKFDNFDQQRIEKFIDAHLNNGPEKTMEP